MVIRRAYRSISARVGDLVVVGDDDGGLIAAQAGDDELADGAGVAGELHAGGFGDLGLVVPAGPADGDLLEVLAGQGADLADEAG
jgi:hypothetical protein